jgi:prevent-host-death family protein
LVIIVIEEMTNMTNKLSVAHAKARLSEVLKHVEDDGARYVIQRRGKPVAAVVPIADLPLADQLAAGDWLGALLDLGAPGQELGQALDQVVRARAKRPVRPVGESDE